MSFLQWDSVPTLFGNRLLLTNCEPDFSRIDAVSYEDLRGFILQISKADVFQQHLRELDPELGMKEFLKLTKFQNLV